MVPAANAQVDHNFEWVNDDGSTDQHNASIRCGPHNTFKHQRGLRDIRFDHHVVTRRPDGRWMLPVGARPPGGARLVAGWRVERIDLPSAA